VALAAVLSAGGVARADEFAGRLGVGGEVNMAGVGGLTINRWFGESLRIGLLVGYQRLVYLDTSMTPVAGATANRLVLELQGFYALAGDDVGHFGISIGAGADVLTIPMSLAFGIIGELGFSGEVMLSDYFAIHASAGLGVSIANSRIVGGLLLREMGPITFGASLGIGPNLSAGFTWYFDKPKPTVKHKKKKKPADDEDEDEDDDDDDEDDDDKAPKKDKKGDDGKGKDDKGKGDDGKGDGDDGDEGDDGDGKFF
jgi:hypothetical protein